MILSLLEDDMPIYTKYVRKSSGQLIKQTRIHKKYWVKH